MALQIGSGKYFQDTLAGNVFIGSTASGGLILPIFNTTSTVNFGIWNPTGSGRNAWPIACMIGYVSTTAAASNFCYGFQTGAGATIGTAAPVTAVTAVAPNNALLGAGNASVVKFFPAAATFTTGCSFLRTMGVSQLVTTAATTALGYFQAIDYFDGMVAVPPGAIFTVAANIAQLSTVDVTLIWEEI